MNTAQRAIRSVLAGLIVAAVLSLSSIANAQIRHHDAFFGYSRTGSDIFYPNTGSLNGWGASLHIHVDPFLGIEGDVSRYGMGASEAVPRTTAVMVGPRVSVKALGINLFAHALGGGEHSKNSVSNTPISQGSFAYALGGGIDLPLVPLLAWRLSGDRFSAPSLDNRGNEIRLNTGLVLRF